LEGTGFSCGIKDAIMHLHTAVTGGGSRWSERVLFSS
jgi:hypothetical protein